MWQIFILLFVLIPNVTTKQINQQKIVDRHNLYRSEVGVDKLKYSKECAQFAQKWAEHLVELDKGLQHSKENKYGENIYWNSDFSSENNVVDYWAIEQKYFNKSSRKYTSKSGHYSQMVWRNTKFVGTGMAIAADGSEYWVCTYYPAGNYVGEKAY